MTKDTKHHHGDLRRALIEAGIAILETDGLAGLSLRKCAARAGVSHAAPAHHFDGLHGLRSAIAAQGFARFEARMRAHADAAPDTPHDQLKAIMRGYIAFAQAEPALFDLIFSFRSSPPAAREMNQQVEGSYLLLREKCAPFQTPDADIKVLETQIWSLVHGYAQLRLTGRFQPEMGYDIDAFLAFVDHLTPTAP